VIARLALNSRRQKIVSGQEEMIGAIGHVLDWKNGKGHVFVHSERWRATGVGPLGEGAQVRVTSMKGLVLGVEPFERAPSQ
jgi:membrane-bound serine protease (ClpP class)